MMRFHTTRACAIPGLQPTVPITFSRSLRISSQQYANFGSHGDTTCVRSFSGTHFLAWSDAGSGGDKSNKDGSGRLHYRKGLITVQQVNEWISNARDARDALKIYRKFVRDDHVPGRSTLSYRHHERQHAVEPNVPTFIYILEKLCAEAKQPQNRDLVEEAFNIYAQAVRQSAVLDMQSYEHLMDLTMMDNVIGGESKFVRDEDGGMNWSNFEIEIGDVYVDVDDGTAAASDLLHLLRNQADARMREEVSMDSLCGYQHMNQEALTAELDTAVLMLDRESASEGYFPHALDAMDDKEFYTASRHAVDAECIPRGAIRTITSSQQIYQHLGQLPPYRMLKSHPMLARAVSLVHQCRRSGMGRSGLNLLPQLFACALQYHDTRSAILALKTLVSTVNMLHVKSFSENNASANLDVNSVRQGTRKNENSSQKNRKKAEKDREHTIHTLFTNLFIDLLGYHTYQLNLVNKSIDALHDQYDDLRDRWLLEQRSQERKPVRTSTLPPIEMQLDGLQLSAVDVYLQRIKYDMSFIAYQLWQSVTSLKWSLSSPESVEANHSKYANYEALLADTSVVWLRASILRIPEGRFAMDSFVDSIDEKIASRISSIFGSFVKKYKQKRRSIIGLL